MWFLTCLVLRVVIFIMFSCVSGPLGVIVYKIADTFVQLKANVTVLGNLPVLRYFFKFGNKWKYSERYTSPFQQSIYMFTDLTADTSYSVSTSIRNKYVWSWPSQSTSITTLPPGSIQQSLFEDFARISRILSIIPLSI